MGINLGNYQHYKGGLYQLMTIGRMEKNKELYVVYRSLQDSSDYPKDTVWLRPLVEFEAMVEHDGTTQPRFRYLGN